MNTSSVFFRRQCNGRICSVILPLMLFVFSSAAVSQGTRLLRQPTVSNDNIVFAHAGDIWISNLDGNDVRRLTSTPAVESDPHFSPDGSVIAFTSNRSGVNAVYTVPAIGGEPARLTWYPASSRARGWTPDGKNVLYASSRETAPTAYDRLWQVSRDGGPSQLISRQWGTDGSYSPDKKYLVIDPISRWDVEWRNYRGGQNQALIILDLNSRHETFIPNPDRSTDIQPVWIGGSIYFLSDRDGVSNIWSYAVKSKALQQLTFFTGSDVKWLDGSKNTLVYERNGYLHVFDIASRKSQQLAFTVQGDFPWMQTKWEDAGSRISAASLSPSGKRALMEARGDIFTVPVEHGNVRNITSSSGAADRAPVWSPKGGEIAWFSDADGKGYQLYITAQDGLSEPKAISIGESKMAWEPVWSPDGKSIAFVDNKVRIRVVDIESGKIVTADTGGNNLERGSNNLSWSPDSEWLAYNKTGPNNFRRIMVWSRKNNSAAQLTNAFADAFSPAWDRNSKHLYFLASTDIALGSGWANTSSMQADPSYAAYIINLSAEDDSPFKLRSDEEKAKSDEEKTSDEKATAADDKKEEKEKPDASVRIDFDDIDRRTLALPVPVKNYQAMISGPEGSVFIHEALPEGGGKTLLHKFTLKDRKSEEFLKDAAQVTVSADGSTLLYRQGSSWFTAGTGAPVGAGAKALAAKLFMRVDRYAEYKQMVEESWRYMRDYFYDPGMHGRDWDKVYKRYMPLVPYLRHRTDVSYVIDMMNGELSVGHSFVFGGDFPETETSRVGLLGADLTAEKNRWKISRMYTTESWNPGLAGPLDQPGLDVKEGQYLVGVNGRELSAKDDPYRFFDGTAGVQTIIHINDKPSFSGSEQVTVEPVRNELALRQRAWVEDNRRMVDTLSGGKLAYVWVPNTTTQGFVSFNRYFFAQQDKKGAVIDERFNGGGLLDDYMVDLMTRNVRAALTNEALDGRPFRLPAGILGPKVLLVNAYAGSGGDFFPWVFKQLEVGPLIGTRTWGGLVRSSVHYPLIDGGALTAPDNAVFDPVNNAWVAENAGVTPNIEVRQDAQSLDAGRDAQLERAVREALKMLEKQGEINIVPPPFPRPAK